MIFTCKKFHCQEIFLFLISTAVNETKSIHIKIKEKLKLTEILNELNFQALVPTVPPNHDHSDLCTNHMFMNQENASDGDSIQ